MKTSLTQLDIDSLIEKSEIHVDTIFEKVTLVAVRLPNGFVITESSGAVDKANYDESIGYATCMDRIVEKLWMLEGYVLQTALAGTSR